MVQLDDVADTRRQGDFIPRTRGTMTPVICSECEQFVRCPSCDDWICWNCGADLRATKNIREGDIPEDVERERR